MVHDKLNCWHTYEGLGGKFQTAFAFVEKFAREPGEDGSYTISDDVSAVVKTYETDERQNLSLENHKKFIDLQYILSGDEIMEWTVDEPTMPKGAYDPVADSTFYEDMQTVDVLVKAGEFVLFWPQDTHKPSCINGTKQTVRKIVIKIKV